MGAQPEQRKAEADLTHAKNGQLSVRGMASLVGSGGVARGWKLSARALGRYRKALDRALDIAMDSNHARDITRCVQTMAKIVDQVQADEHLAARIESGIDTTHNTQQVIVQVNGLPPGDDGGVRLERRAQNPVNGQQGTSSAQHSP